MPASAADVCNCKGYAGPGGQEYSGPGGPAYDGPGGPRYSGPGGPAYNGPGGPAYNGHGGPCYSGPGGTGRNCPLVCRYGAVEVRGWVSPTHQPIITDAGRVAVFFAPWQMTEVSNTTAVPQKGRNDTNCGRTSPYHLAIIVDRLCLAVIIPTRQITKIIDNTALVQKRAGRFGAGQHHYQRFLWGIPRFLFARPRSDQMESAMTIPSDPNMVHITI